MKGHVGKILKLDLTNRKVETIPTQKYEKWVGGKGMGMAIFFEWAVSFFNTANPGNKGLTPEVETKFYKAVTGEDLSYEAGLEIGRRIWNLERSILVLQGRHRDEEYFPPYPPYNSYVHTAEPPYLNHEQYPVFDEKTNEYKWEVGNFQLKKEKWDEWKTLPQ